MKKHVIVQSYDENWKKDFVTIRDELNTVLNGLVLGIEHVGSTSVEGLSAKPIIDIDVVIQEGLEKMTVWSSVNSMTHLILEKMGFRNRYPITYFGAVDLGIGQRINLDIWDFRNWSINMGDDNVY